MSSFSVMALRFPHTLLNLPPTPRATSEACSLTCLPLFKLPPSSYTFGPLPSLSGEQCIRFKSHNKKLTDDLRIGY